MSTIAALAAFALAALIIWKIGAPLGRAGGMLLVILALVKAMMGEPIGEQIVLLAGGVAIWLAAHFLHAYQRGYWGSRLAEKIVTATPLRYIDPVYGSETRRERAEDRAQARAERAATDQAPVPAPVPEPAPAPVVDHFAEWARELEAPAPAPATSSHRPAARRRAPSVAPRVAKRAAKIATKVAVRAIPGARAARSAWRLFR